MAKQDKLLKRVLAGGSNTGFRFEEVLRLLQSRGFRLTIKGSHHKLTHPNLFGLVNLQPTKSGEVKPYQLRQVRQALLALEGEKGHGTES